MSTSTKEEVTAVLYTTVTLPNPPDETTANISSFAHRIALLTQGEDVLIDLSEKSLTSLLYAWKTIEDTAHEVVVRTKSGMYLLLRPMGTIRLREDTIETRLCEFLEDLALAQEVLNPEPMRSVDLAYAYATTHKNDGELATLSRFATAVEAMTNGAHVVEFGGSVPPLYALVAVVVASRRASRVCVKHGERTIVTHDKRKSYA